MTGSALPIDAISGSPAFPAATHRCAQSVLMPSTPGRALGARSGVRRGALPTVSVNPTTLAYDVTPFSAVVDPGTGAAVGPYLVAFLADETGTLNPRDATNPRVDRLDVVVPADSPVAGATSATLVYTAGTAVSSPSAPAAPARSMPVCTVRVPAVGGADPTVTLTAPYVGGGITHTRGSSEYPSSPYVGQYIDDASLGLLRWDGTSWIAPAGGAHSNCTNTTGQNIPTASVTTITGWAPGSDGHVGLAYSAGAWTVQQPGQYDISGLLTYPAIVSPAGQRVARLHINGTVVDEYPSRPDASFNCPLPMRWGGALSVGDTIVVATYQSQGATTALGNGAQGNHIHIKRISS